MNINTNNLISFEARNNNIKMAQNILHKIKTEYSAGSPYIVHLLSEKHLNMPISGKNWSNHKLYALRQVQEKYIHSDLEYSNILLSLTKKARVANCKEYSEIAFIAAKINGIKDCCCVNFAKLLPEGIYTDIEHSVLLINQKIPKNRKRLNKFYVNDVDNDSAFKPSKKAIVIDPLFGIVDYWNNAVINYQKIYPNISAKNLYVAARELIITTTKDLKNIKQNHPELLVKSKPYNTKQNFLKKISNFLSKLNSITKSKR